MTEETKHTPGPWEMFWDDIPHSDLGEGWTINSPEGSIAVCDGPSDENEANARLIAAAPDLLEALESLTRAELSAYAKARAAIAKAKGKP